MAAALAPVKLQLLSDTRHQLVADLAPAVATLAFKGLLGHYNFTVEEVDLWDRKQFPLWDVPAVPCEALDMVRAEEDWFRSRLQMRVEMATEEAAMGTHDTLQASSEDDSACAASEVRMPTPRRGTSTPPVFCTPSDAHATPSLPAQDDDDSGPSLAYDHVAEELSQEFSQRSIGSRADVCAPLACSLPVPSRSRSLPPLPSTSLPAVPSPHSLPDSNSMVPYTPTEMR